MNGTFEKDATVWPIGYMLNGGASVNGPTYNIVDMRDLEVLLRTECTCKELAPIVHTLNENLRAGLYEENYDAIKDDALLLVLGGESTEIMARDIQPVPMPVVPDVQPVVQPALASIIAMPELPSIR